MKRAAITIAINSKLSNIKRCRWYFFFRLIIFLSDAKIALIFFPQEVNLPKLPFFFVAQALIVMLSISVRRFNSYLIGIKKGQLCR
jgi:hypothetical protein